MYQSLELPISVKKSQKRRPLGQIIPCLRKLRISLRNLILDMILRICWSLIGKYQRELSILETAANNAIKVWKDYLNSETVRQDRQSLAELILTYLTDESYRIRQPGAVHHACFLAKASYYMKMELEYNLLLSKKMQPCWNKCMQWLSLSVASMAHGI